MICAGQPDDQIHKSFTAKWGRRVPLRCGRWNGVKGFGVRKLVAKGRWNTWFKGMIAVTLAKPYTIEQEGTTLVYRTRVFTECTPGYHFRVVVQTRKLGSKRMRGIITAYQRFE